MSQYRHTQAAFRLPDDVERLIEWTIRFEAPVRPQPCIVKKCGDFDCKQTPEGLMCLEHWLEAPACSQCGDPGSVIRIRKFGIVQKVVLCRSCYCGEYDPEYLDEMVSFLTQPKSPPLF